MYVYVVVQFLAIPLDKSLIQHQQELINNGQRRPTLVPPTHGQVS